MSYHIEQNIQQLAALQSNMSKKLSSIKEDNNTARGLVASLTESNVFRKMHSMAAGTKAEVTIRRFMRGHNWVPSDEFIEQKFKQWDNSSWKLTSGYPETIPPEWITGTISHIFADPTGNYRDGVPIFTVLVDERRWDGGIGWEGGEYLLYPFQIMDIRPISN
jgi:hypothetical protein